MSKRAAILGAGHYAPEKVITNFDLEKIVNTTDEWMRKMTGMVERRASAPDQPTSDLAYRAGLMAIENAGLQIKDIDFVLVATVTGDYIWPATANIVVDRLGLNGIPSLDISAACSGFVYGLTVARSFVEAGLYKKVLLIGAEEFTKIVDWTDRNTCVLFGDGAGAVVVGEAENEGQGIISTWLASDGSKALSLLQPGGGVVHPINAETIEKRLQYTKMDGKDVFKNAVIKMPEALENAMRIAGVTADEVDYFIFHQANKRIIDAIAERFGQPESKMIVNIQKYANTSAATIPIALSEAIMEGRIKKGNLLGFSALGAGFTWGGAVVRL